MIKREYAIIAVTFIIIISVATVGYFMGQGGVLREQQKQEREEKKQALEAAENWRTAHEDLTAISNQEISKRDLMIQEKQVAIEESQARERRSAGEVRRLRGSLAESEKLILTASEEELVDAIPPASQAVYPQFNVTVAELDQGIFATNLPGLQSWSLSLEETSNLRLQIGEFEGQLQEKETQIKAAKEQEQAQLEKFLEEERKRISAEEGVLGFEDAQVKTQAELDTANQRVKILEAQLLFTWIPKPTCGVMAGVTLKGKEPDVLAGCGLTWKLPW